MQRSVVLAFSGGLDTSYCTTYLSQEKNLKVIFSFCEYWGLLRK